MRLLFLPMIIFMVILFALAGCGVKGERLMTLASFKQIEVHAHGPIFMKMVRAYYETSPESEHYEHQESPFTGAEDPSIEPLSDEEHAALIALFRIQSFNLSQPIPEDRILQSMSTEELWKHLSARSRSAYYSIFSR